MTTRRGFLESLFAVGAALPALRDDALPRLARVARQADRRPVDDITRDEDFWREVQEAFTLDRTIINLNNGGVSPSPRVVQDAMRRYLEYSNTAPAYTMWQVLEPEIEAVRHRLAASFGCDAEEMAITRNASEALEIVQLGIPLERGDEVVTTAQDYPRMLTTWHQRERREGIVPRETTLPRTTTPSRKRSRSTRGSGRSERRRGCATCSSAGRSGWSRGRASRSSPRTTPRSRAGWRASQSRGWT